MHAQKIRGIMLKICSVPDGYVDPLLPCPHIFSLAGSYHFCSSLHCSETTHKSLHKMQQKVALSEGYIGIITVYCMVFAEWGLL